MLRVSIFAIFLIVLGAAALASENNLITGNGFRFSVCGAEAEGPCGGVLPAHQSDSSQVALLLDEGQGLTGEVSFAARMQKLLLARHSIRIQALIFAGDEAGIRVADTLKQKKKENPSMDIRVIVDAMSNPSLQTQMMYYDLKQHGIEVEGYEAIYLQWINEVSNTDIAAINKRFHDKMWIIDGEGEEGTAVVGGLNIANEYFRVDHTPKNHWRDQDVIVKGAIVTDIVAAFDRNYNYFKAIKASRPAFFNTDSAWSNWRKIIARTGKLPVFYRRDLGIAREVEKSMARPIRLDWQPASMRFVQSRPRFGETYIQQAYLNLIEGASHPGGEILLANAYFIPEPEIREALKRARARGAQVTVLTNSLETNDLPQLAYASRFLYKELMGAGVQIWEYAGAPYGEGTIHAKFGLFDRRTALVGSYNLDARSQKLNSETALVFENTGLVGELANQYLKTDLAKSRRITDQQAEEWHNAKGLDGLNTQLSLSISPML